MFLGITLAAVTVWFGLLLLPWRPWSTREHLEACAAQHTPDLRGITVLMPARNEAPCIAETLAAVAAQGTLAGIVLVDDQSDDGTGDIAEAVGLENLRLVRGTEPPSGWSGKLWALEQGLEHVSSEFVLLLDADIELAPGTVAAAAAHLQREQRDMVSLMAALHMDTFWERLLMPPFVYFFKLIYPFALANSDRAHTAAAAGGFVLLKTARLRAIGGFAALRDAIIDDCTLARRIKSSGGKIWIGLTRDARAIRPYGSLSAIWEMVARTAYTQLYYSPWLLLLCTAMLLIAFVAPVAGLLAGSPGVRIGALASLGAMMTTYLPTLGYYRRPASWALTLPLAAVLFLAMTWTSAYRYFRGERSRWKQRAYARGGAG